MAITSNSLTSNNALLITSSGKRTGRYPDMNSTVEQRRAANARERSRMSVVSSAFIELRRSLPWVQKDTKLSKLDTLKLAAAYILYLRHELSISKSHLLTSRPYTGTTVESGLLRTETSLKLQSHHSNFKFNSNLLDNTLPDTTNTFSFLTNNSCFKKCYTEDYPKYSCETISQQEDEFLLNLQHNHHQHTLSQKTDQQHSWSDQCIISPYQHCISCSMNQMYHHPPPPHHSYALNSVNHRNFNSLSISSLQSLNTTQTITDIEYLIIKPTNEPCNNDHNDIYHMKCMDNDSLSMRNNPSVIYSEFYPHQNECNTSLS